MPAPSARIPSIVVALLAALAAAPAEAGAKKSHAASCRAEAGLARETGSVPFADGFEGGLHQWSVQGHPRVQSRLRSGGKFALRIPGRRARDYLKRQLANPVAVTVSFCVRDGGGRRGYNLLRLGANRTLLRRDGKGRLVLSVRGRRRSVRMPRRARKGKWLSVSVGIDARTGRARLKVDHGQQATVEAPLKPEHSVVLGNADAQKSPPYYLDDVHIIVQPPPRTDPPPSGSARLFSASSFWNAPLAPRAALDPTSATLVDVLASEAEREYRVGTGPWIDTDKYSTPLYTVPADQPTERVELMDGSAGWRTSLQTAFQAVPIPPSARAAAGTDGLMTIWQPSTDKLWEFWQAKRDSQGRWGASWGGAMQNVSNSPGYFSRSSWPGAGPWWGASASSLPVIGGTMRLDELARGRIDHTLGIAIPSPRAKVFSWPAQRTDGRNTSPTAIPEGARFRLDPTLDINSLRLPRLVRMMAEAAQRYGLVVRDTTGVAIGFGAQDYRPTGMNPWWNEKWQPKKDGYLEGKWPHDLLSKFPWRRLQLLEMSTCSAQTWDPCSWQR